MRHLFTPDGRQALAAVMGRHPVLAFDFDGTLAPIVARPDQAHVPDAVAHGLAELSRALPVAVVTGRSVADVRARLGFQPRWVIGNHGAEDPDVGPPSAASQALDTLRHPIALPADAPVDSGRESADNRSPLAPPYRLR